MFRLDHDGRASDGDLCDDVAGFVWNGTTVGDAIHSPRKHRSGSTSEAHGPTSFGESTAFMTVGLVHRVPPCWFPVACGDDGNASKGVTVRQSR